MKLAFVAVAALAVLSVVRGEENDKSRPDQEGPTRVDESDKSRPVNEVSKLVKKAFPYAPAVAQKKEDTKEPDAQVVTMERFIVVESRRSRELEKKIKSENEKTQAEKFSVTKGGAIWKKGRVEFGAWPVAGAGVNFYLLKITW